MTDANDSHRSRHTEASEADAPPNVVRTEERCIRCGYILCGLLKTGNCPECGLAVRRSMDARRLSRAPREWLKEVREGLETVRKSLQVLIVTWLVAAVLGLLALTTPEDISQILLTLIAVLAMINSGIWVLVGMSGFAMMLVRDPFEEFRGLSKARGVSVLLSATVGIGTVIYLILSLGVFTNSHAAAMLGAILTLPLLLAYNLLAITTTLVMRGLSRRSRARPSVSPEAVLVILLIPPGALFILAAGAVFVPSSLSEATEIFLEIAAGALLVGGVGAAFVAVIAYATLVHSTAKIVAYAEVTAEQRERGVQDV